MIARSAHYWRCSAVVLVVNTLALAPQFLYGSDVQSAAPGYYAPYPAASAVRSAGFSGQATASSGNSHPVNLKPGDDIQAAVNSNPPGTTFSLGSGVFRLTQSGQGIIPLPRDTFQGQGPKHTVISGARVLTGWTQTGNAWYVGGQTQQGAVNSTGCPLANPTCYCAADHPRCVYPEELFIDNSRLILAGVHDAFYDDPLSVIGPGKWYFDYVNHTIYVGTDPTNHTVETSVPSSAFSASTGTDGVNIRDLTVEKFATPTQIGAIHAVGYGQILTNGWAVQNVEVRLNHGDGIVAGNSMQIVNSYIHDNGILGIGGGNASVNIIQNNEISGNNQDGFSVSQEAGGVKFAGSGAFNNTFSGNHIHDNLGDGLWCDYCGVGNRFDSNTVVNNSNIGIQLEVTGYSTVSNNVVKWNARDHIGWLYDAQIMLSSSWSTDVFSNFVEVASTSGNAITIVDQNRSGGSPVMNNRIYSNQVIFDGVPSASTDLDVSGAATDSFPSPIFSGTNTFTQNTYCVQDTSRPYWVWNGSVVPWAQWQSYGQDPSGLVYSSQSCPATAPAGSGPSAK